MHPTGAAAATNGFASSSTFSQAYSRSATAVHSSLRSVSARGLTTERLHSSRSAVPPTPPTRDRARLEPYNTDRSGNRFSADCAVDLWSLLSLH